MLQSWQLQHGFSAIKASHHSSDRLSLLRHKLLVSFNGKNDRDSLLVPAINGNFEFPFRLRDHKTRFHHKRIHAWLLKIQGWLCQIYELWWKYSFWWNTACQSFFSDDIKKLKKDQRCSLGQRLVNFGFLRWTHISHNKLELPRQKPQQS